MGINWSCAFDVEGAPKPLIKHLVEVRAEVLDLDPHVDGGGDGDGQGARSDIDLAQQPREPPEVRPHQKVDSTHATPERAPQRGGDAGHQRGELGHA